MISNIYWQYASIFLVYLQLYTISVIDDIFYFSIIIHSYLPVQVSIILISESSIKYYFLFHFSFTYNIYVTWILWSDTDARDSNSKSPSVHQH